MSVLQGANNTTITNGVFNAVFNNHTQVANNVIPPNDIVSVLLSHSATAGLLDAAERFDAPKCDEGTRTSMLLGMKKFVQQGSPSSVFWLHGPAGVGKSALAQTLALSLKDEGDHAASFFFSRTASGRSDGNKLIVTLACQLALSIPPLKPLIAKAVKENPLIFSATNVVKMQTLIVEPLNRLHKKSRRDPLLLWAQRVAKRKLHPRLILVDGLDECDDPLVQRDILLCIGNAVRQLSLPFRFIIASRPESHILATFELDPVFQGPHGVGVISNNLGDDEDADEQITTFLLKEFAEIRRTHPIREHLPQPWPLPGQIAQLVSKSSKGFIYPTTVIRYIKMLNNRPDECLERILGMSEIPVQDKPYEPLDVLYRYIFESVPDVNKEAVRNIFHFLVLPSDLDELITPRLIEKYYHYKPGRVQHVLRDLLCVVTLTAIDRPIKVLHASLPDFLLDPIRCGSLCIHTADAHAVIIVGSYEGLGSPACFDNSTFTQIIHHLMHAKMTEKLLNVLIKLDPLYEYRSFYHELGLVMSQHDHSLEIEKRAILLSISAKSLEFTSLVVAYFLALIIKEMPAQHINNHIKGIETYILRNYALGAFLHTVEDDVIFEILPSLQKCARMINSRLAGLFATSYDKRHPSQLVLRIAKLHMLMMTPYFVSFTGSRMASDRVVLAELESVTYPRLAHALLDFFKKAPVDTVTQDLLVFVVDLISASVSRSGYYKPLLNHLEVHILLRPHWASMLDAPAEAKCYAKLTATANQYIDRVKSQDPATTPLILVSTSL